MLGLSISHGQACCGDTGSLAWGLAVALQHTCSAAYICTPAGHHQQMMTQEAWLGVWRWLCGINETQHAMHTAAGIISKLQKANTHMGLCISHINFP